MVAGHFMKSRMVPLFPTRGGLGGGVGSANARRAAYAGGMSSRDFSHREKIFSPHGGAL